MAYLPGYGQVNDEDFSQINPLEKNYSPRLFGSPPQLSSLCDMRIDSGYDNHEGETGDWYRNKVLKNAQVANFFIGRALFTGGYNSLANILRQFIVYQTALQRYNIFGNNDKSVVGSNRASLQNSIDQNQAALDMLAQMSTEGNPSDEETDGTDDGTEEDYYSLEDVMDTGTSTAGNVNSDSLLKSIRTATNIYMNSVAPGLGIVANAGADIADATVDAIVSIDALSGDLEDTEYTEEELAQIEQERAEMVAQEGLIGEDTQTTETKRNLFITGKDLIEKMREQGRDTAEYLGIDTSASLLDLDNIDGLAETGVDIDSQAQSLDNAFGNGVAGGLSGLYVPLIHSLSMGQSYYTFEADWYTYINNVKMMINAAIIMLGLQSATVRIGNKLYPIGMNVKYNEDTDVWTNYRYITPDDGVGTVTSIDTMTGDTSQYVSFMVDTVQESSSYSNQTTTSKIYSTMAQGNEIGNEIAFITNSSGGIIDDAVVNLAGSAIDAAEKVMDALTFGVGKFTAAIAASMGRSYLGDHPIYPKIFQSHECESSMTVNVKLRASHGDPYSYLTEILVPLFHILGMVLPKMSTFSAGAYQYPPIIQCQIPGVWGTRLGIIKTVSVTKNPDGGSMSINGYPLAVNVSITIENLQNCMVTTGMNEPAYFLNNQTMFDYIAQSTGVDKYRSNSAARVVTRLALAASYGTNIFYNIGSSIANDLTTLVNKHTRVSQY